MGTNFKLANKIMATYSSTVVWPNAEGVFDDVLSIAAFCLSSDR
jgi:hypothetical protein